MRSVSIFAGNCFTMGSTNRPRSHFSASLSPVAPLPLYIWLMQASLSYKRTSTDDHDFQMLINLLDHELWQELHEDQATYDQYNQVPHIATAIVLYAGEVPVACGCFKPFNEHTVEIKRMYVKKASRGRGFSRIILRELEQWASELGFTHAVLETSVHFATAKNLYASSGYQQIANYPPYEGLTESVCMKKTF